MNLVAQIHFTSTKSMLSITLSNVSRQIFNRRILKRLGLICLILVALSYATLRVLDKIYPPHMNVYDNLSTIVSDREGKWLRVYLSDDDKYRLKTTYKSLPDDYSRLLINYEDKDFFSHNGIDISAVVRAALQNIRNGRIISGASTITMQTARLLMPQPRSFRGKIIQTFRAWQLERLLSKEEILDIYVTLAPVGGNREGLLAACHYYLNKPPSKLSLGESAWLIALTQSPERLFHDTKRAKKSRDKVLKRALDFGIIDLIRYKQALAESLSIDKTDFPFHAPQFSNYARASKTTNHIMTSIDKRLQISLENTLSQQLTLQHKNANLAGGLLDNKSGEWLAYVSSADYFNAERKGRVDMLRAVRSPGSTLKPFITLFAFDWLRYQPQTTIDDTPIVSVYHPSNYDGLYQGRISLSQALVKSRNVPAVRLLGEIKPAYFIDALKQRGIDLHLPKGALPNLSIALGGVGVRGAELSEGYRQLANCAYHDEKNLARPHACKQVTEILQQNQDGQGRIFYGREPVAFKTGTAYGWRDRWIFSYTKDYTIVLWSGRADGQFAEQRASAEALIPVLRQVVGFLPNPPSKAPDLGLEGPIDNESLPLRLRHVGRNFEKIAKIANTQVEEPNALTIIAPLPDSTIDFRKNLRLSFHIQGGTPPFIYLLNDSIVSQTNDRQLDYSQANVGSYHLLVIDAKGSSVSGQFRLKAQERPQIFKRAQWK